MFRDGGDKSGEVVRYWCGWLRGRDGGAPRLHCAGDLWPFVTLSEREESESERFLNSA